MTDRWAARHLLGVPLLGLALLGLGSGIRAQHGLFTFRGEAQGEGLGWAVCGAGDVDGDGHDDVLAGAPWSARYGPDTGSVQLISGRAGQVLFQWTGMASGDWFGNQVAVAGDVDRDGKADFVFGAPQLHGSSAGRGYVRLVSGRDGSTLLVLRGMPGDHLGTSVAGAGDVDGDGHADVIAGAPYADANAVDAGAFAVWSGRTGMRLFGAAGEAAGDCLGWSVAGIGDGDGDGFDDVCAGTRTALARRGYVLVVAGQSWRTRRVEGTAAGDRFGSSVAAAGDVDRDGRGDLVIGACSSGEVQVISGRSLAAIHRLPFSSVPEHAACFASSAGDTDGDGWPDILVGTPLGGFPNSGNVTVISGRTGKSLFTWKEQGRGYDFGWSVAAAGDVNGDGTPDILVGEPRGFLNEVRAGAAWVLSPKPMLLAADAHALSLSSSSVAPGAQRMQLYAGPQHAGRLYLVIGSLGGTQPGVMLGAWNLPLNPDIYFMLTIAYPNTPLLSGSFGLLDARGEATATFHAVPEIPRSLAGSVLHHAYLVLAPGAFELASNAVPLLLLP